MSTFAELATKLSKAKERKALLQHQADYLSDNFLSTTQAAKKVIYLEDKINVVSQAVIDVAVGEMLEEIEELDDEINTIHNATMSDAKPT